MENTCCFFGHRKIDDSLELRTKLNEVIEKLIVDEKIDTFLFGSKSQFNSLCYELVTNLKRKYPYIKRIYVRAEFPHIDDSYKTYLLESYIRVKFYNSQDMSAGFFLHEAETIFENWDKYICYNDINTLIELL